LFVLENFVAVLEFVELRVEALPDRTDPRIANERHLFFPEVA
jgi:hypothetical protein